MTAEHDAETRVEERTDNLGEIAAQSEAADRAGTEPQPEDPTDKTEPQPEAEDPTDKTQPQPVAENPTDKIAETEPEPSADDPADKIIEPDGDAEDQAKTGSDDQVDGAASRARNRSFRVRAGVLIGVLVALLGFAIAVQVRSNSSSDNLSSAREEDLIRILDDQNVQATRLRQQIADLQRTVTQLQAGGDRNSVALQQAQQQLAALGVLLGTLPATGPGVVVTVTDPARKLQPEDLLDIVQELRGAGAEAIQFGGVRVGVSTSFTAAPDGVQVDDTVEQPPYVVRAIGDPKTLDTALNIPGGVAATARAAGGDAEVAEMPRVTITALRQLPNPKYASPSGR
jgi:uncharacterized protein YlxW (UPF0749 family)